MTPRVALALAALLSASLVPVPASARNLFESDDGEFRLTLRTSLKGSWLLTLRPEPPEGIEGTGGAGLFRLRFDLGARLTRYLNVEVAYEHRSLASSASGVGTGFLPTTNTPPFRLSGLDWVVVDDASYVHRHELDRAFVALHLPFLELTVGRQALGLGRGLMFSAVDLFAPFSPNEVDREWRRGVDAAHAELRIPDLPSLSGDLYAVLGGVRADGSLETWSLLGRIRAVVGDVDAEVILGRRAEDNVVGGALSATLGDAEVHGEFSLFGTDGRGVDGGFFGTRGVVAKGLVGGSYRIDVLRGINVVLEYHHSGFGIENVSRDSSILLDPFFQARFLRGDSQILGRHVLALALSTDLADEISWAVSYFQSPVDGSGMVTTAFTWIPSDILTLLLTGGFPWGTAPDTTGPRSEWGSSPFTIFVQARVYD